MKFYALALCASLIAIPAMAQSKQFFPIENMSVVPSESPTASYIEGKLKNESGKNIDSISLTFNLYDEQGNVVGNAIASAATLAPGDTWAFKALAAAKFSTFKQSGITTVPKVD